MNSIVYDFGFMDEIKKLYDDCCQTTEELKAQMDVLADAFESGYQGMALEVVHEALEKMKGHLELLRLCQASAGTFVAQAKADMQEADTCTMV